jgi:uncharacterized protein YjaZ
MIQTKWMPTDRYYRELLSIEDLVERTARYQELLVAPWQGMMSMLSRSSKDGTEPDSLAGPRLFRWLLPDQVEQIEVLLSELEAANAWETGADSLEQGIARFTPYANKLPLDEVTGWLILQDGKQSSNDASAFEHGYTGGIDWVNPQFACQFWNVNEDNLRRLPGLVVHEMHHLIRLRLFPWGPQTSVADYIVVEGTAEAFAASLFGEDKITYIVSEVQGEALERARQLIGSGLVQTGFDTIRGYIFGDALANEWGFSPVGGMPTYGGYAIGYHVVKAFLERTGLSVEEATFLPALEIIRESRFFDALV